MGKVEGARSERIASACRLGIRRGRGGRAVALPTGPASPARAAWDPFPGALPRQTKVKRTVGVRGPRRTNSVTVEPGGMRYSLEGGQHGGLEYLNATRDKRPYLEFSGR
jgi:hypothetical protein